MLSQPAGSSAKLLSLFQSLWLFLIFQLTKVCWCDTDDGAGDWWAVSLHPAGYLKRWAGEGQSVIKQTGGRADWLGLMEENGDLRWLKVDSRLHQQVIWRAWSDQCLLPTRSVAGDIIMIYRIGSRGKLPVLISDLGLIPFAIGTDNSHRRAKLIPIHQWRCNMGDALRKLAQAAFSPLEED